MGREPGLQPAAMQIVCQSGELYGQKGAGSLSFLVARRAAAKPGSAFSSASPGSASPKALGWRAAEQTARSGAGSGGAKGRQSARGTGTEPRSPRPRRLRPS